MIADRIGADYIIDDGLIIRHSEIMAGRSAKAEKNQIRAIRRAMFEFDDHRASVMGFISKKKIRSLMIIATSEGMALKIAHKLCLPEPEKIIRIEDVASPEEIERARYMRRRMGQHVIPASHVQVRKNFTGHLVGVLRDLWSYARSTRTEEKTIVRPPFSFYGDVKVAPSAIEQLVRHSAVREVQVASVGSAEVNIYDDDALKISLEIKVRAGQRSIMRVVAAVRHRIVAEINYMTGLSILEVNIKVTGLEF